MTGSAPVETAKEAPIRDNGWTEAILNLRAIEEQLQQIALLYHELMGGGLLGKSWATDNHTTWMDNAVAPLVYSRLEEI